MADRRSEPANAVGLAYGLSSLGGVILFLGWVGFGYWPLELVALVPLWAAFELVSDRSWRATLCVGWLYGTIGFGGGYHWMLEFTTRFSGFGTLVSFVVFVVFSGWLGLQFGVQGLLYRAIRARGWSVAVAALPTLVATEWLFPRMFPAYLANALVPLPILVQSADLGGPLLVSALVAMTNVAALELLRWWRGRRRAPVAIVSATAAIIGLALVYGAARIAELDARIAGAPALEVGLVQVNMGVFEKREQMLEAHRRYLEQSAELEKEGTLDLLIWPESAYNDPRFARSLPVLAKEVRGELRSPLMFGGLVVTWERGYRELFNSVFVMDETGLIGERYDKTRLAMFGEYLPFGELFPRLYMLSPNTAWFTPGTHLRALSLPPWRISTPICYEAILPDLVRDMVIEGAPHILINLSNDAWFGDTQGPWIHLRLAQLRAVEHRRYLVRATNSGVSAVVDPAGRLVAHTDVQARENLRATVRPMHTETLYARVGDWPGWASMVVMLACMSIPRRKR